MGVSAVPAVNLAMSVHLLVMLVDALELRGSFHGDALTEPSLCPAEEQVTGERLEDEEGLRETQRAAGPWALANRRPAASPCRMRRHRRRRGCGMTRRFSSSRSRAMAGWRDRS